MQQLFPYRPTLYHGYDIPDVEIESLYQNAIFKAWAQTQLAQIVAQWITATDEQHKADLRGAYIYLGNLIKVLEDGST